LSKLAEAFKELCAVSRVRPDLAAGSIEDAARRLWRVLGEYPEAVALTALDVWPRRSEWFPAEKELRGLLEEIASNAAREAQARGAVGGGKYRQPVGNTVGFVEEVRRLRGADYCKSWLAGGITCLFSANIVYTTSIGADRLDKDVGALAAQLGVKIVRDKECSEMLARYCDERQLSFEPKGRRR
jgi:hypothetical protein